MGWEPSRVAVAACFFVFICVGCGATADEGAGRGGTFEDNGGADPTMPGGGTDPAGGGAGSGEPGGFGNSTTTPTEGTGDPKPQMGGADCESISETAEPEQAPVDIVWVIDSSGSMGDEQARVQNNITNFVDQISMAGLDARVVMITDKDLAMGSALATSGNYMFVPNPVGSRNALDILINTFPMYSTFLRPGTTTHFVVLTDDESNFAGGSAAARATGFETAMRGLFDTRDMCSDPAADCGYTDFTVHAIASPGAEGALPCQPMAMAMCVPPPWDIFMITCAAGGAAAAGATYTALAMNTGGVFANICETDWSSVFDPLITAVIEAAPLPCNYMIPDAPEGEVFDKALVNVSYIEDGADPASSAPFPKTVKKNCDANEAWHYDDEKKPKEVLLCPAACDAVSRGGTIDIAFGCDTILLE